MSALISAFLTFVVAHPITAHLPTYRLRQFFTAQAEAILSGRLWIDPADGAFECFTAGGHCYGYFGITPSLLRIPFLWLAPGAGFTDVFVFAALILGILGSLVLVNVVWTAVVHTNHVVGPFTMRILFIVALALAGPGNLWLQLTLPTGYEEAIIWAATFVVWALVALLNWWRTGLDRWLVLATVLFILGANSRPSVVPVAIAAAAVVLLQLAVRRDLVRRWRATLAGLAMALLPLGTAVYVWFAKFGVLVPPLSINYAVGHSPKWANIMRVNGDHDSWWGFIPTNVLQYLRPDALTWSSGQLVAVRPHLDGVNFLPPLTGEGVYVTEMASVTSLVPVAVFVIVLALWRTPRISAPDASTISRWVTFGIATAAWSAFALLAINVGVQNRYMGDLAPAIAISGALGTVALTTGKSIPIWLARSLTTLLAILTVAGIVIGVLHQEWQIARYL